MNNLESKVVSLELAKRMAKLGWEKETLFYHWWTVDGWKIVRKSDIVLGFYRMGVPNELCLFKAPLFCEVWNELPGKIKYDPDISYEAYLMMGKGTHARVLNTETSIYYEKDIGKAIWDSFYYGKNPTESASELWCWLKENGYTE